MEKVSTKTSWIIDLAHSEIGFKVRHLMISNVNGTFKEFGGAIYLSDDEDMTAEIDFWLNAKSINTNDEKRDGHLKSDEFFDSKIYKRITFTGTRYAKTTEKNGFLLYGDLTIKGITKSIELSVELGGITKDPWGNQKVGYSIKGEINRQDWGLTWNTALETGGVMVSDQVKIICEVQLTKQS